MRSVTRYATATRSRGHDLGRRAFSRAHGAVHPAAHDRRTLRARPVDAAARLTQRGSELGEHARRRVADHAAARIAFDRPVLLDEVDRRRASAPKRLASSPRIEPAALRGVERAHARVRSAPRRSRTARPVCRCRGGSWPASLASHPRTSSLTRRLRNWSAFARSPHELATIHGVGPSKLDLRRGAPGGHRDRPASIDAPPPAFDPPPGLAGGSVLVPTEEWTWRLLNRGFTLDEAAAIRGLNRPAVIRHVLLKYRQGKPVDPLMLLDPHASPLGRLAIRPRRHLAAPQQEFPDLWPVFLASRHGR